jgi:hypothetical protein
VGIDRFREHFADHQAQYALIGGVACDLIFAEAGLEFRATKDFDVVLCVEVVDVAFAAAFRGFLEAGGYEAREQSDGHREFYRFHKPSDKSYPHMIELFSRQPDGLKLPDEMNITKVAVDDDLLSLSAILLDDDYYAAMQGSKTAIDGISIVDHDLLIPFKAKAYLDLTRRKANGGKVDSRHIRKHRNDVFQLAQLLVPDVHVDVSDGIAGDLRDFLNDVRDDEGLDPMSFGVDFTRDEGVALLEAVYRL